MAAHLPVLVNLPGVKVAWIADRDAARAGRVARSYGSQAISGDTLQALNLPEVDVLLIAIPYGARRPFYEKFRGQNIGWYIEKPFAKTVAEHRELCALAPAYAMACGFQRRALGVVRIARDLIESRVFGRPVRVEIGFGYRGRIVDGGGYAADPKQAGGGALAEVGIHCVDAALYMLQAEAVSLRSAHCVIDCGMDIHTEASVSANVPDGAPVELDLKVSNLEDTREGLLIECEHAKIEFSIFKPEEVKITPRRKSGSDFFVEDRRKIYPSTSDQVFHAYWATFVEGWRNRTKNFTAAADCVLTTQIVEEIYARARPMAAMTQ